MVVEVYNITGLNMIVIIINYCGGNLFKLFMEDLFFTKEQINNAYKKSIEENKNLAEEINQLFKKTSIDQTDLKDLIYIIEENGAKFVVDNIDHTKTNCEDIYKKIYDEYQYNDNLSVEENNKAREYFARDVSNNWDVILRLKYK